MNEVGQSLQGKQLTASVARDRMEFSSERILETFVCHRDLDSVLVLQDSADELDGDMNECEFFHIVKRNVSLSRKSAEHSKLILSQ